MGRLVYSAIVSLDGHVSDGDGRFDWAETRCTLVSDPERPVGS